jgi:hypothetical protein
MNLPLAVYNALRNAVQKVYTFLHLEKNESTTGRSLAIPLVDSIALAIFKQTQNIATKKSLFDMVTVRSKVERRPVRGGLLCGLGGNAPPGGGGYVRALQNAGGDLRFAPLRLSV